MPIERKHICQDCIFLAIDIFGRWFCTKPDDAWHYKSHPYGGACVEFKTKKED